MFEPYQDLPASPVNSLGHLCGATQPHYQRLGLNLPLPVSAAKLQGDLEGTKIRPQMSASSSELRVLPPLS